MRMIGSHSKRGMAALVFSILHSMFITHTHTHTERERERERERLLFKTKLI